ncbi:MAG: site-specific integrase [Deltaproteobacteria bacterium]|nr:site-specific integrase [Deltaproteobacteria bacterium]
MAKRRRRKMGDQKRTTRHASLPSQDHNGSWRIRWVDAHGKRRSANFAPNAYADAVAELERIKGELRAIKDGRAPAPQAVPTFADFVATHWLPNRAPLKRSAEDDASILRAHLMPVFADLRLNQITTARVDLLKARILGAGRAPATARNVLALLSAILNYAVDLDYLHRLPCRIVKPATPRTTYAYLESKAAISKFLSHAKDHSDAAHAMFATAIYTGMRFGELAGLRWTDVDLQTRLITVARSFDKPTKSGHVRHVPILDVLFPTLRDWRLSNGSDLVFPNEAGHMHTGSPRIVKFTFPEVLAKARLPRMRFHDLRHTFASHWVMNGGDLFRLQKILGHADQAMVQRYAHLAPDAFDKDRGIFGEAKPTTRDKVTAIRDNRRRKPDVV